MMEKNPDVRQEFENKFKTESVQTMKFIQDLIKGKSVRIITKKTFEELKY